jgi:hypothetical protein
LLNNFIFFLTISFSFDIPPKRGKGNTEVNQVGYVVQRLGDFVFGWKMNTSKGLLARVNVSGHMMGGCDVRGCEIPVHH